MVPGVLSWGTALYRNKIGFLQEESPEVGRLGARLHPFSVPLGTRPYGAVTTFQFIM